MLPLPSTPYEACERRSARVSSLSLVRYRGNDYSVPVAYGHREVLVRGYVETVVIGCGATVIARHRRSYEREDVLLEPLHYRGKRLVVLVGQRKALSIAVRGQQTRRRWSKLKDWLQRRPEDGVAGSRSFGDDVRTSRIPAGG
jgi:hypothetical protein